MEGIFDSHAHYDDEKFDNDRDILLPLMHEQGVKGIMTIGASIKTSEAALSIADRYDFVFAAAGVHPEMANEWNEDACRKLETLLKAKKCKALGEIGLDYYWEQNPPKDIQREAFIRQIELARDMNMPVIIHDREAHGDSLEILRRYRPKGVVHCFSGSAEMAAEVTKLGMYVGFTGAVTFKNARRALEAAAVVPNHLLLIETDCPYMAPEPFRGQRCDSRMLEHVAIKLAEIRHTSPEEIVFQTCQNAELLYEL